MINPNNIINGTYLNGKRDVPHNLLKKGNKVISAKRIISEAIPMKINLFVKKPPENIDDLNFLQANRLNTCVMIIVARNPVIALI